LLLSIITINLNNAAGLRNTIESVVSQTSRDFEYIVIDGGSSDGSVEILKKFAGRITYWICEPDKGIYQAMNKGIKVARGEYCQFLNSGDRLATPDVVDAMLSTLPDCSIYYGNMLKLLPNGSIFRDKGPQESISMLTFYRGTINHSPALIKRSLFDRYGFYDENLKIVSDWKWYLTVVGLHNETIAYRDMDVTIFDMTGISNQLGELNKAERRIVIEELFPPRILKDYDAYWRWIEPAKRLNRYSLTRWLFWLLDRCLFELEKSIVCTKNNKKLYM
jgi:glycosyltransferase involved in cell wall biosynthesis